MGASYSTVNSCSPSAPTTSSRHDKDPGGSSMGYPFSEAEANHLLNVRRLVCRDSAVHNSRSASLISLIWGYSNQLAMSQSRDVNAELPVWIKRRCQRLETISCCSSIVNSSFNGLLKKIFLHEEDAGFLEFVSNMLWMRGNGCDQTHTLNFVWDVCLFHNEANSPKNEIRAKDFIELCIQLAALVHYMTRDNAFVTSDDDTVVFVEQRNVCGENGVILSMTNSLLEYATRLRAETSSFEYGVSNIAITNVNPNDKETISKNEMSEWQLRVVPDLLHCSFVSFFNLLFFPPNNFEVTSINRERDECSLIRRFNSTIPILRSSKEITRQVTSRLKENEVVPMTSAVFGKNYREIDRGQEGDNVSGRVASMVFSPALFAFNSVSESKFGRKWYRLFSGIDDGWTFHQLERSVIGFEGPTLTIIQGSSTDTPNSPVTFGAYTAAKWERNKKDFFGNPDCFLFQLQPTFRVLKSLPKIGTRGGHYMYFHSTTNVVSNNPSRKDELVEGLGFGGTVRSPRLFIDRSLEECRVSSKDTTFEEGCLGLTSSNDPLSSSFSLSENSSSFSLRIDSLEIYAVGDEDTMRRGFLALNQHHDIADATLRNARTVDKAAFLGDMRNGVIESKAFAHRTQVDGRADNYN